MSDLMDAMKKAFLAGVGAAAEGTEKAESLLKDMVKKGELTVEQGKVLNQELKHDFDEKVKDSREKAKKNTERKDMSEFLKNLSAEDLKELKAKLDALDGDAKDPEDDSIEDKDVE